MNISENDFSGKNIAVLGFGVEGESTVKFLLDKNTQICVFDEKAEKEFEKKRLDELINKGVKFYFGKFPKEFSGFDLIVRSPGISLNREEIKVSGKKTIITSPTKIFFDLCPCKIIGVTGTKGKGTTSTLIYEMLKKEGIKTHLGGNIGTPALDFLNKLSNNFFVVLELSSFQLQDLAKSPNIAVVLMMTSEHLDYHQNTNEYVDAKRNILRFQKSSDFAVINKDYPASRESDIHTEAKVFQVSREASAEEGCFVENGKVKIKRGKNEESGIIDVKDILLPGRHNLENVCAAVMAAKLAGVSNKNISQVLRTFKGLEHRLELIATVEGVRYYDDSFSTTPETATAAIEAFTDPEILILGGSSKGSDFTRLGELISKKKNIKTIIGIGKEWPKIKSNIENEELKIIEGCKNMHDIVKTASQVAGLGDVVLLTPACASFDMFKNYKDRGEQFKKEVNKLKTQTKN